MSPPIRCPITYELLDDTNTRYSVSGLRMLHRKLITLHDLPYSAEMQRAEAIARAEKISIQGVQAKLSAILNVKKGAFELVNKDGQFILKPPSHLYRQLPENEDLTMRLAKKVGIETPLHGLIYSVDGSLTYFIKRFDRHVNKKIALEDFSQLLQHTRDTKYSSSMEHVATVIEKYCTFPLLEKKKLFERTLFNFLIGNEDMHLKNFSLISRNNKIELAPAYDFVNSTLALVHAKEELALPLKGRKRNLTYKNFVDYFAYIRLGLNTSVVENILENFSKTLPVWNDLIMNSFLAVDLQEKFLTLLKERATRLQLL